MKHQQLLSLAALARRLDVPEKRARELLRLGKLKPDSLSGPHALFRESRLAALAAQIPGARLMEVQD